jgi:hypothetical protein
LKCLLSGFVGEDPHPHPHDTMRRDWTKFPLSFAKIS